MTNYTDLNNDKEKISKQSITLTTGGIISAAVEAVVGYIAIYFFAPVWKKIIKKWDKKDESKTDQCNS